MKTTIYLIAVLFLSQQANATIIVNNVEFPDDVRFYRPDGAYVELRFYYQTGYYQIADGPIEWNGGRDQGYRSAGWNVFHERGFEVDRNSGDGPIGHHWGVSLSSIDITGISHTPLDQYFFSVSAGPRGNYYEPAPAAVLASLQTATSLRLQTREHDSTYRYLSGDYPCREVCTPEPAGTIGWLVSILFVCVRRRLVQ